MPKAGHIQPEITSIQAVGSPWQLDLTFAAAGSTVFRTPASGKRIRLKIIILELSADVTIGYRWGAAGTIYYLRTTKGPFVCNLVGANDQGAVDEALYIYASGACSIKGTIIGQEI